VACFPQSLVFRALRERLCLHLQGHLAVEKRALNVFKCIADTEIEVEVHHIDLSPGKSYTIDKLEKLEILPRDRRQQTIQGNQEENRNRLS